MMSEKKENVLIVHNHYQIPGGEDTVVANEKEMLENHGHKTVLYSRNNSELQKLSKIKKCMLPFSTIFNIRTYRDIKNLIREEKIDVVHVHNTLNLVSPAVYYAAQACEIPVVQTIHNFRLVCPGATFYRDNHICEDCVTNGLTCAIKHNCYRNSKIQTMACVVNAWIHRFFRIYEKLNYICLTEFNREKLLQLKQIKREKVFVKPNFVQEAETIVSYDKRKNQFVYVGRLDQLKGIDFLLETWKDIPFDDYRLIICGAGPLEEWCRQYVMNNQLKNVEIKGFVDNKTARNIIGESKALVLPTRWYEGFPMTIVESYSVGTPVIGSDIGNVGSLIENERSGWKFVTNSKTDLIKAFEKARSAKDGLTDEIICRYSEEKNYEQLRKIYETCCNHH